MPFFGVPIRNGLPIGLGSVAGFGVQQFDPSQLFEGGTVAGAWYDSSDLSTMFDTSAGTTPVAMPGQGAAVPVGLMLDKSQGLVLGSELTTGILNSSTNWTLDAAGSVTGGALVINTPVITASIQIYVPPVAGTFVVGKFYRITFNVTRTQGTITVAIGSAPPYNSGNITASGAYSLILPCGGGTPNRISFTSGASAVNNFIGSISNISVRELPGNHAISFNNTTARPELRARVNLLVATATLSTQSVTTQATSYTLSFAGAGSITLSGTATGSYSAGTHTITCTAGTLTLTVSGTVTTADLRPANSGALLPAYQAVVDANTYDTSGFPLYLRFDGIDDSMYTPANLNLSGTDKVAVFAGVRQTAAGNQQLVEFSADVNANNGAFSMPKDAVGAAVWTIGLRGTSTTSASSPANYAAPITTVNAGLYDIGVSTDEAKLRINGAQVATSGAGSAGTGNFGTYPLYIGSRNNSSVWFNGHLYSLVVAGSAVSAGNISATEQWVAGRTGIQI